MKCAHMNGSSFRPIQSVHHFNVRLAPTYASTLFHGRNPRLDIQLNMQFLS